MHIMTKSKQLIIELTTQIEILFKECFSQKQNGKKLKISRQGVQYSLQRQFTTGGMLTNVVIAGEDNHLIVESKRNRRKTALGLTAENTLA